MILKSWHLATVNFSSGGIDGKFLSVWKNFIGNINSGQTSRLNVDKFDIGKSNQNHIFYLLDKIT